MHLVNLFYILFISCARYLLIFIKIPQGISTSGIFDQKVYYSDFGFGLTNSPIELFITLIILFLILFTAFRYTLIYYKANNKKSNILNFIYCLYFQLYYMLFRFADLARRQEVLYLILQLDTFKILL